MTVHPIRIASDLDEQSAYDNILDALRGHGWNVHAGSESTKARCPVHDDDGTTLKVTNRGDHAELWCYHGCNTLDILAAIGLSVADLTNPTLTPIPLAQSDPLPEFPVRSMPWPVGAMVDEVAAFTQTDRAMAAVVVIGVLSACSAGRVKVQVIGNWTEPLCIYCAVVSAPGTRKSPVVSMTTAPLVAAEAELVALWRPAELEARTQKQIALEQVKRAERSAAASSSGAKGTAEAISAAMYAESIDVPVQPRILADDLTPEALTGLLATNNGRVAIVSAEGGIFDTIAGRYSNGVPNLDAMLKGWSAEPIRVDRRGRPSEYVERAHVTMCLTIQPSVLAAIARNGTFRGRGLLARFLYATPPNNVGQREVGMPPMDPTIVETYDACIRSLTIELQQLAEPATLQLSAEAARTLLIYEKHLEPRLAPLGDLGPIADWASKAVGQAIRLAGLLHIVAGTESLSKAISDTTMCHALALIDYFTAHAKAAFAVLGTDEAMVDATFVLDYLKRESISEFTVRDVHARLGTSRFPKVGDLKAALDVLEAHRWVIARAQVKHTRPGRPPSPVYVTQFTESTQ